MKNRNIILVAIVIIVLIPIIINEINMRPKLSLVNDVKKILKNIKDYDYKDETVEIVIDNGYTLNSKTYKIKGKGIIFIEENSSVMLSRNGMCAMKLPYSEDIMLQNEECPNYRLVDGEKMVVTETK